MCLMHWDKALVLDCLVCVVTSRNIWILNLLVSWDHLNWGLGNGPGRFGLGCAVYKVARAMVGLLMIWVGRASYVSKWEGRPMDDPFLVRFKIEQTCTKKICTIIIVIYRTLVISLTD